MRDQKGKFRANFEVTCALGILNYVGILLMGVLTGFFFYTFFGEDMRVQYSTIGK